jgi:hypothetical protein
VTAQQYEVVVRGQLGTALTRWFDRCEVKPAGPGATALSGWFPDQAALHGFLAELGDLGFELASVRCLSDPPPGPAAALPAPTVADRPTETDESGNR